MLADSGILHKQRVGRSNHYVNVALYAILTGEAMTPAADTAR